MKVNIDNIATEMQNVNTMNIDTLSTLEMIELINREDQAVIDAVKGATHQIANAVDVITECIDQGGRLIYIGAGTSGRLGVLDASEILPTYGVGEESVVGIIAGGDIALRHPVEASEDSEDLARADLKRINVNDKDIICAIASSGRTPYCIGGLKYAAEMGAKTLSVACVSDSVIAQYAQYVIETPVGQEVITGSTRMKSGSATKMVLNMLSSGAMIKLGKVYGNLMVDVKTSNLKLIERAKKMIMRATSATYEEAEQLLNASDNNVKTAIVMKAVNVDKDEAVAELEKYKGRISKVIENYGK